MEGKLERALSEDPRPGGERKLTGKEEALLLLVRRQPDHLVREQVQRPACPTGRGIRAGVATLSRETVRRRLAENDLKP